MRFPDYLVRFRGPRVVAGGKGRKEGKKKERKGDRKEKLREEEEGEERRGRGNLPPQTSFLNSEPALLGCRLLSILSC